MAGLAGVVMIRAIDCAVTLADIYEKVDLERDGPGEADGSAGDAAAPGQ